MTTNIGAQAADAVNDKLVERQKLEQEMYAHHQDLQTLISQRNENEMVKEELEICEKESSDATIYKQVGPVLLKNDLSDATDTIEKRLEFISGEIKKTEGLISKKEGRYEELGKAIQEMQNAMQKAAVEAAKVAAQQAAS
mmetsp:Transcript_19404/g.24726  ORF Transcript_19404/g.24726 Transcript_19404/m.24726 type:complete len:140 (-) Transcript_19404:223-642(-)|eukprot:CAMPEP_0113393892 /NCGR_PEP_ID=MMETSP0013_2-20120614/12176_1 /TAXON_ID=2843 ORGANISM="Skeletonema costatum, Strain 1716" /NCGR_SAMPLE_ID=MMETSP0013_2 /ASSEMBLY_ACC=CAM_ASM_000158 /LENGTH=139 /DNA_ID=CAMNT_0000277613 /DNA_START=54 /DNA_END=473 /DNA_ORIENTATION=- /assembly_acc=CAM_ASM_000158